VWPEGITERPDLLDKIQLELVEGGGGGLTITASRSTKTSTLVGMGGIGKTTLATMVCHRPVIQNHFRSGVVWLTCGNDAHDTNTTQLQKDLLSRLLQGDNEKKSQIEKRIIVKHGQGGETWNEKSCKEELRGYNAGHRWAIGSHQRSRQCRLDC